MYNFKNDYSFGAHPNILQKLLETNLEDQQGYGEDQYSIEAKEILKKKIENPNALIYFLSGGTQTNLIVISFLLRIHEAVISAKTGHIFANETGAIEATGHRVITVETSDGKLNPELIQSVLDEYNLRPHVVKPKMVYISNSTEIGTVYNKSELEKLSNFCKEKNLILFMDGARLGHALASENNDVSFTDLAKLTDVFYIYFVFLRQLFLENCAYAEFIERLHPHSDFPDVDPEQQLKLLVYRLPPAVPLVSQVPEQI